MPVNRRSSVLRPRNPKRVKYSKALLPFEQLLVTDREQRPAQRGEYRELVVGPPDGGERGTERLHFFAIVEALAADEDVAHTPRFERAHIGLRHVFAKAQEPPEEDADVPRFDGGVFHSAAADRPSACGHDPLD